MFDTLNELNLVLTKMQSFMEIANKGINHFHLALIHNEETNEMELKVDSTLFQYPLDTEIIKTTTYTAFLNEYINFKKLDATLSFEDPSKRVEVMLSIEKEYTMFAERLKKSV